LVSELEHVSGVQRLSGRICRPMTAPAAQAETRMRLRNL
jgi:hypothetical protein